MSNANTELTPLRHFRVTTFLVLVQSIPYYQSNAACKKHGYCPGNVLSAGFRALSAINQKKFHWDNLRIKQIKQNKSREGSQCGKQF